MNCQILEVGLKRTGCIPYILGLCYHDRSFAPLGYQELTVETHENLLTPLDIHYFARGVCHQCQLKRKEIFL